MMFSNYRDSVVGLLVLRHLHSGDIIDYPISDSLPQAPVFKTLEEHKYIERWRRTWPLSDRYRITATGAQTILSAYKPDTAERIFNNLCSRQLAPSARPQALRALGLDPNYWPILHDPYTHWMTWPELMGPFQRYVWAPDLPPLQHIYAPPQQPIAKKKAQPPKNRPKSPGGAPRPYHHSSYEDDFSYNQYETYSISHSNPHEYGSSGYNPMDDFRGGDGGESGGGGSSDGWGYGTEDLDGGSSGDSFDSSYSDVS